MLKLLLLKSESLFIDDTNYNMYKEKHLRYRNVHYLGSFQFIINIVKEPQDNLHLLYMEVHIYRINISATSHLK